MGNDPLFKKRQERDKRFKKRQKAKRAEQKLILIFCEGEKTEPEYLANLRDRLKLTDVNIQVDERSRGRDPLKLVRAAEAAYDNQDILYCVFDRDRHESWDKALARIKILQNKKKAMPIKAITSTPCFEFWLLLHFKYSTKPYSYDGKKTACEQVIKDLKAFLPEYQKNPSAYFDELFKKLNDAIANAKQIQDFHKTSGTTNPSTEMHLLVEDLLAFKEQTANHRG